MEKNHATPILASYVTYKELSSHGNYKSPYQILAEFIKYIIYEKKLYAFSIGEIKSRVENEFEFYLPDAVLKSALKKIDFVTYDATGNYCVNGEKIRVDGALKKYRDLAETAEISVSEQLISFIEETKDYKLNNREKKELMRAFVSYLIDESNGNKYQEEISSFIIKKSDDKKITEYLNSVREGVILYTGLNYNIDEIGSLKRDLTLYLDMEVLFDIYGYNGEVFQRLALDLFKLARDGYTIFAYGDSKIDLYMLREADKGFLYIGKRISRSLKNESLSGLVPIYDHSLVILADEDEEVQADIAICKSNSGISGSRLAAAHVRLGEKIGRHIATVFPEKNTSILVLERGGRFFGDGVYMGAGGIFYSMNPKQDDAPVINTERVVIVDSVINTGKSIMRIIDELKNHNPGIDVIIAANVIQNEAAELFKDYLVFATRLSKNSFVGVNQSKQTGKTGPDTADRLFNLIKKRY